jgi:hypothetical protein
MSTTIRLITGAAVLLGGLIGTIWGTGAPVALGDDANKPTLVKQTHTLTLTGETGRREEKADGGTLLVCQYAGSYSEPDTGALVGSTERYVGTPESCDAIQEFWVRAPVDLEPIVAKGAQAIDQARVSFNENILEQSGSFTGSDTCVGEVDGIADIPEDHRSSVVVGAGSRDSESSTGQNETWDVTVPVKSWFANSRPNEMLLMHVHEWPKLFEQEDSACVSAVTNLRLEVSFLVPLDETSASLTDRTTVRSLIPTATSTPNRTDLTGTGRVSQFLPTRTPTLTRVPGVPK